MSKKKDGSDGRATLTLASIAVPLILRKVLAVAWTKVFGKRPPIDLTDPKITFPEALGWAVVLAVVVETARFGVTRAARQRSALEAAGHGIGLSTLQRPVTGPRGQPSPRGRGRHAAHSRQTSWPFLSSASWLRWCTRKQREQVNSSACRGITRNESSSFDRSAPGSSSDSATSSGSRSMVLDDLSIRRACSS